MANIDMTVKIRTRLLDGKRRLLLKEKCNVDVPFEWIASCLGVGDNTGTGYMKGLVDLGSLNPDVYYTITNIISYTDDTGQKLGINTQSDWWMNLVTAQNMSLNIWEGTQVWRTFEGSTQLQNIIYLGKPNNTDSDAGKLYLSYTDHAGTSNYYILIQGYALKEPLPLSTIFQQNPIG